MSKVLGILEISPGLIGFTVYSRVAQTNPGSKSGSHLCRKKFGVLWVRNYDPEMTLCVCGLQKMALKCIRELRSKKKDGVPLVCKICKSKMFTATATLMYHYRSHAGTHPYIHPSPKILYRLDVYLASKCIPIFSAYFRIQFQIPGVGILCRYT